MPISVLARVPVLFLLTALVLCEAQVAFAQSSKTEARRSTVGRTKKQDVDEAPRPREYKSRNFHVRTDLPAEEAKDLLGRLETMLSLISRYWGQPNQKPIEMYVVRDINHWPPNSIPPEGLESIQQGAGVTTSIVRTANGRPIAAKAIVYAVADRGTPQHEAVHAYCAQNFGRTGPTWYSEGMAEMGQYWQEDNAAVNCSPEVVQYLKQSGPKELTEIVSPNQFTGDSWQNYAWRWALCHLLANNTNYAPRFRPLGLKLLTDQNISFEQVYGPMAKEITFEYLFFLKHFDIGYRADLCSWDWKAKFRPARGSNPFLAKIEAAGGWQPSRLEVLEGTTYEFSTTGTWKLSKDGDEVTAAGDSDGKGMLVGVVFDDYELSEPFELGAEGTFKAPRSGNLFLRCADAWNELADNSGTISVKLRAVK